jgi:hypothetical protein
MGTPVWEDTVLDLFIEARLHAVHVLKFVGSDAFVLVALPASTRLFKRAGSGSATTETSLASIISFCHLI